MTEKSCGTIPYTIKDGVRHYLLIKNRHDSSCGFPKGHVEANESETETALRETWEETSIKPIIDSSFRYEMSYRLSNGNRKTVVYFLAKFENQRPHRNQGFENFEYLLLPFDEAYQALTFENARQMLIAARNFQESHLPHTNKS